jgi:hypothetical protein
MNSYVPSGFWVYSPTKSPTVVSPSPATVIRSGKAASTRLVSHAGQHARPVDLPARACHRARLGRRGGSLGAAGGAGEAGGAAGFGTVGEGGQRVADRAGRPAEVFGDLADRVRAGAGGQPLGNLATKLAVAEPALRRGGSSGAVIGNTFGKTRGRELRAGALRHDPGY